MATYSEGGGDFSSDFSNDFSGGNGTYTPAGVRAAGIAAHVIAYSPTISGGVKAGSRARVERFGVRGTITRRGIASAMASDNIGKVILPAPNRIVDPNVETAPALSESRYRLQDVGVWKDFGEDGTSPFLPAIVKGRQGRFLPPKTGGTASRFSRQIATATGV